MEFYNYGDVMYIRSEDDYREWVTYKKRKYLIEDVTQRLDEWDNRENVSFHHRPSFKPFWTREDLKEWIEEFENTNWGFVEPVSMKKNYFEENDD